MNNRIHIATSFTWLACCLLVPSCIRHYQTPELARGSLHYAHELPARVDAGQPLREASVLSRSASRSASGAVSPAGGQRSVNTLSPPAGDAPLNADELALARVCWKESTFRRSDCAAIAYVLKRRARARGWTFERMAYAYSLGKKTERSAHARSLPDGDARRFSPAANREWSDLREYARDALAGRIANPCPRAGHWGGMKLTPDLERATRAVSEGAWVPVDCRVDTVNTFFAMGGAVVSAAQAAGR